MAFTASILERLARRDREAHGQTGTARTAAGNVRNVHLADEERGEPVPEGVDPHEWASWGEEARYVLLERLGVGDDQGMPETDSLRRAVVEARMAHAGLSAAAFPLVARTLEVFEDARIVSVEPRSAT